MASFPAGTTPFFLEIVSARGVLCKKSPTRSMTQLTSSTPTLCRSAIPCLFQKGLLSSKRVQQENGENKSCRKTFDLQTLFCTVFIQISSKKAMDLARIGPTFPQDAKLDVLR
jgi:hypothetical protein